MSFGSNGSHKKYGLALLLLFVLQSCADQKSSSGNRFSSAADDQGSKTGSAGGGTSEADYLTAVALNGKEFLIDTYEAMVQDGRARSLPNVDPKVSISFAEAKAACVAAGKRICTRVEWLAACEGFSGKKFGFQDSWDSPKKITDVCDVARTSNNQPGSLPSKTGAKAECKTSDYGIHDMIGNAAEWVDDSGKGIPQGAAFYQPADRSECDVHLLSGDGKSAVAENEKSTDIGFRCCADFSK